jgi:hypothetical protein
MVMVGWIIEWTGDWTETTEDRKEQKTGLTGEEPEEENNILLDFVL